MSRPFSYNDENFTVIGNILFIHIPFNGKAEPHQIICHIPPEINKRIQYKAFVADYYQFPGAFSSSRLYIVDDDIRINHDGDFKNGEFFAVTNLKDI